MVALDKPGLTIASLLMLQQMEYLVQSTVWHLCVESKRLQEQFRVIRDIYTLSDVANKVKDGDLPYPAPSPSTEKGAAASTGVKIEFR